jgi:hypothetical protein
MALVVCDEQDTLAPLPVLVLHTLSGGCCLPTILIDFLWLIWM